MKKIYLLLLAVFLSNIIFSQTIIISQYTETNSGTTPKGIELWNPTSTDIDFSISNLVVKQGTNGGVPSTKYTLNTGILKGGEVIVLGTNNMSISNLANPCISTQFYLVPFVFNGNDALQIELGGTITDIFGTPNTDPGSAWTGEGVSTKDNNIALKSTITTGSTTGWTDPSLRFETVGSNGQDLTGFGIPPGGCITKTIYEPTANTCEAINVNIAAGTNYVDVLKNGNIIAQINPNGNNLGNTTVEVYKSSTARQDANGTNYLNRSIFISPTTQPEPAKPVSVRLFITQSEFNDLVTAGTASNDPNAPSTINDLNLTKVAGTTCGNDGDYGGGTGSEVITPTPVAYGTGYYLQFDVTAFSGFFGHGGSAPLPVEWKDIYVETNATGNRIHWELASEKNVDYYLVESSTDGRTWATVAPVSYSPSKMEYSYTDIARSMLTYYRIKQVDFDGQFSYSKVLTARNSKHGNYVYPNPVEQGQPVKLKCNENCDIQLLNAVGNRIHIPIVRDNDDFILPTQKLKRGIYFIQINETVQKLIIR